MDLMLLLLNVFVFPLMLFCNVNGLYHGNNFGLTHFVPGLILLQVQLLL